MSTQVSGQLQPVVTTQTFNTTRNRKGAAGWIVPMDLSFSINNWLCDVSVNHYHKLISTCSLIFDTSYYGV